MDLFMTNVSRWLSSCLLSAAMVLSPWVSANETAIFSSKATAQPQWAEQGMVSSQEALASQVGVDILRQGGMPSMLPWLLVLVLR